jgi:hypothetical protein
MELLLLTELLSSLQLLTYPGVVSSWLLVLLASILLYRLIPAASQQKLVPSVAGDTLERLTLAGITTTIALTALTALLAAPNNFDSQTYHLGRIVHWMQNHAVAHYPTNITRQLYSAPLAEYGLLHLHILWGSDRLFNLLQWSAMVGCLVAVAMITRLLGGKRRATLLAVALCATIPMGILQSSGTQNDYVTAFWLICFVWASLLPRQRLFGLEQLVMSCSLGLAIITKGSAYPLAFSFLVWAFLRDLQPSAFRGVSRLVLTLSIVLAINSGHYIRNWQTFGTPLSTASDTLTNENLGIRSMTLNMGRNLVMQFATPFAAVNRTMESAVAAASRQIALDPADPRTSLGPFVLKPFVQLHEDFASNPLHTALIIITISLVATYRRLRKQSQLSGYLLTAFSSFALFSLLLKWQPFGSRLLLPLFVIFTPACAVALSRIRRGRLVLPLAALCFACALPWLLANSSRPLLAPAPTLVAGLVPGITPPRSILASDRLEQYYVNKPEFRASQQAATTMLHQRGCSTVGLNVGNDYWEYTLWVQLERMKQPAPRFEHLNVQNGSAQGSNPAIKPECIVLAGQDNITYLAVQNN